MRYSSLSNLKKKLWTKFHKVVMEIGRLIDSTPSKTFMKKGQELPNTIIEFVKYTMLLNNIVK